MTTADPELLDPSSAVLRDLVGILECSQLISANSFFQWPIAPIVASGAFSHFLLVRLLENPTRLVGQGTNELYALIKTPVKKLFRIAFSAV